MEPNTETSRDGIDRHDSPSTRGSNVAVMLVGTPRSGTTLLQRALADGAGYDTVPETHLFTVFAPRLLRTAKFPLDGASLKSILEQYVALKQHRGGAPTADALFDRLGGRATNLVEVFSAVVAELSNDSARVVEKTPDHLLWVPHLAVMLPTTKFVAVVRDPRAVVASTRQVHWGQQNPIMAAERWSRDQRLLLRTQLKLGRDRVLLVSYEDLVSDEAETVERIVRFVDHDAVRRTRERSAAGVPLRQVYREHEEAWKSRVAGPVTTDRIDAWRTALSDHEAAGIERVCNAEMNAFGYDRSAENTRSLTLHERGDRYRYSVRRVAHEARIRYSYLPRAGMRIGR